MEGGELEVAPSRGQCTYSGERLSDLEEQDEDIGRDDEQEEEEEPKDEPGKRIRRLKEEIVHRRASTRRESLK